MTEVWTVTARGGQWEDSWEALVSAWTTKEAAEADRDRLQAENDKDYADEAWVAANDVFRDSEANFYVDNEPVILDKLAGWRW